jgi:hypothetical protein
VLGARELFKTDVSSAFNRIKLSFETVISQATQIDTLVVFQLIGCCVWLDGEPCVIISIMSSEAGGIQNHQVEWISPDGKNIRSITADRINHAQVIKKVSCTYHRTPDVQSWCVPASPWI